MTEPWLAIIGLGEDGPAGLSEASRAALARAEVVFGAPRHLALVGAGARGQAWPVPFDLGPLLARRGERVAMLVSGDPFWFGAGGSVAAQLSPAEWVAHPVAGSFSLLAARLGWRLEEVACLGLHAAPFERLRPVLAPGVRVLCTLRDGPAVGALSAWLGANGFGAARLTVAEALGGPRERLREGAGWPDIAAPVTVAIDGATLPPGAGLPRAAGLPDEFFQHDGQITKAPVRAVTLSALAPRPGALLWDLGAGSGSVSVEWCLAGGRAVAVEARADRAATIGANARHFGLSHRIEARAERALTALPALPRPDAVFVGGGGEAALYDALWSCLPPGTPVVANGVTLEAEGLLSDLHARHGGTLLRIEIAAAGRLGRFRDWQAARPVVQWRGQR
ncbi:precorrin-6y C5,15-methyltransferase (decarboxylating) subunit CbiE [Paracoccus sanguinis]|uniref:precorrin-6y C5,15-methyltransferase (decarboxylating) subunit CbiE n=1 Tax=Paracoccus sanguinis TaxID=1545044 RepID=UPI00145273B9|nr:precorrin-6y C5,15-methyltransferase (decarboxylating) subunit CbiE [Paracoccus sanguinis]QJD18471.1 precorrin-6y C5,15-methyltransferase (decarboxylating) subunit CbiE [Paracoccus sanguinis]